MLPVRGFPSRKNPDLRLGALCGEKIGNEEKQKGEGEAWNARLF